MSVSAQHPGASAALVSALALTPCASLGCAFSVGVTPAASIDTLAKPGGEGRIDGMLAGGNNDFKFYVAAHGGGGYLSSFASGYGLVAADVGMETGDEIRFSAGPIYAARIFDGEASGARHGLGGGAALVFEVADLQAEDSALYLGPRLQAEHIWGQDEEKNRGLFTLGLELRWVTFDTTGNSWGG